MRVFANSFARKAKANSFNIFSCGETDRSMHGKCCFRCCCCRGGGGDDHFLMYSQKGCEKRNPFSFFMGVKKKTFASKGSESALKLTPQLIEEIPFLFHFRSGGASSSSSVVQTRVVYVGLREAAEAVASGRREQKKAAAAVM